MEGLAGRLEVERGKKRASSGEDGLEALAALMNSARFFLAVLATVPNSRRIFRSPSCGLSSRCLAVQKMTMPCFLPPRVPWVKRSKASTEEMGTTPSVEEARRARSSSRTDLMVFWFELWRWKWGEERRTRG